MNDRTNSPVKYLQVMCSSAHTYGNAVAFIEKWLLDQFPTRDNGDSIFRTINVSSKIAHKQILRTPHEISKNNKPAIMIRPRVDFTEDRFLQNTPLTDRMLITQINYAPETLQPFFYDQRQKIAVKYQMNRTVMYLDVVMLFSTLMQQLNYATYIKNTLPLDKPFDLDTCFESYLAPEMLDIISDLAGVPIESDDKSVKSFLNYMNQNSITPVTYKLQGSTNSKEFYRYYPVKLITNITNFNVDDGERNGLINDNYQISLSIRIEFYTTGMYFLFSDKVFKRQKPTFPDDSSIIPIYTDALLAEDWNLKPGWSQYTRVSCRLTEEYEEVSIGEILNPSIKEAIRHYNEHHYHHPEIIDIMIREQGRLITNGIDYTINYEKLTIKFNRKDFGFFTYTIMVCINAQAINDLIMKLFHLD